MIQLELYVDGVEEAEKLFTAIFGLSVIEEKAGWRHLRHQDNYDIMLFDPTKNPGVENHWPLPETGTGGSGIEIVICTTGIPEKRALVQNLGYQCSNITFPPWGSTEFTFRLKEGYLLRIKQPADART